MEHFDTHQLRNDGFMKKTLRPCKEENAERHHMNIVHLFKCVFDTDQLIATN
jgi:hypothetical protein